jgi:hypothetical protein
MGSELIDYYSLLHVASGIIAFYFGIPLWLWALLHALFEIFENQPESIYFIDNYLIFWPGGKKVPDHPINSLGDELFAILGWIIAYFTTKLFNRF